MKDPYTIAQWHQILSNAHKALQADPSNARARVALKAAVAAVALDNAALSQREATAAQQPETGTVGAAVTGFGEGASLGLASKLGNLLPGPSNTAYLAAARREHPVATFGGDVVGSAATGTLLAAAPLLAGLSPVAKGVVVGGLLGAGRGAVEAPPGERTLGGAVGGLIGAGTGYVGGKVVGKIAPAIKTIAKNLRGAPAAAAESVIPVTAAAGTPEELAVAKQLGLTVDQVRGRVGASALPRRGLLEPSLDQPAFTRGTTPMTVEEVQGRAGIPTRAAQQEAARITARMEQMGKGRIQPYYPRGGEAEQTLPPPSVQSAPVIGPASPEVVVRQSSYAQLMQALGNPQTLPRVRQAILSELQRRGIVGTGLLAPS